MFNKHLHFLIKLRLQKMWHYLKMRRWNMRKKTWNTVGRAHMELLDSDIQAESSCKSPSDKSWIDISTIKQEWKQQMKPVEMAQRCSRRAHVIWSVCELWHQCVASIPELIERNAEHPWVLADRYLNLQIPPMIAWCYPSWGCFLVKMFLLGDFVHTLAREIGEFWHNYGAGESAHKNCWKNQEADTSTCDNAKYYKKVRKNCEKSNSDAHSDSLIFQTLVDMCSGATLSLSHRWIAWWQRATAPSAENKERRDADILALLHMLNMASRLRLQQKELWLLSTVEMLESQKQTNSR